MLLAVELEEVTVNSIPRAESVFATGKDSGREASPDELKKARKLLSEEVEDVTIINFQQEQSSFATGRGSKLVASPDALSKAQALLADKQGEVRGSKDEKRCDSNPKRNGTRLFQRLQRETEFPRADALTRAEHVLQHTEVRAFPIHSARTQGLVFSVWSFSQQTVASAFSNLRGNSLKFSPSALERAVRILDEKGEVRHVDQTIR